VTLTSSPAGRPGPEVPSTRERLIQAGFRLWLDEPPAVLFSGFSVSRIAKAAGVTRATFYSYWPSADDYLGDLASELVDGSREVGYDRLVTTTAGSVGMSRTGAVGVMLESCAREFDRLVNDPGLRVRLGFLSKMDDPEVGPKMRECYRAAEAVKLEAYKMVGEQWGREARPPFDEAMAHTVYQMVGEALAARHVIDPEGMPAEIYPLVILGLMLFISRRLDDSRSLPELIEHINSWPSVGAQMREHPRGPAHSTSTAELDGLGALEVVRVARRLHGTMGWGQLTITEIASVSGVTDEAVFRTFGSKPGLAMSIIDVSVGQRLDELGPDPSDPITAVRHTLTVVRDELERDPALSQSALLLFSGTATMPPGTHSRRSRLRGTLLRQLEAARDAGQLRPEINPDALAAGLVRVLVTERGPRTTVGAADLDISELLLLGAGAPAAAG
jgi:AcrR family transcriptional regulator